MSRILVILVLLTCVSLTVSVSEPSYGRRLGGGDPGKVKPPTTHGYNLRVAPKRKSRFGQETDSDDDYYPPSDEDDRKIRESNRKNRRFEAETESDDEYHSPIDESESKGRVDMNTPFLELDNYAVNYESQEADALDMLNSLLDQKKKEELKGRRGYPLQKNRRVGVQPHTINIDVSHYNVPHSWLDSSHPEDLPTILPRTSFIRFDPVAPADRVIKKSRRKTNEKSSISNRNVARPSRKERFAEITSPIIALKRPGMLRMGKTKIAVTSNDPRALDWEEVLE